MNVAATILCLPQKGIITLPIIKMSEDSTAVSTDLNVQAESPFSAVPADLSVQAESPGELALQPLSSSPANSFPSGISRIIHRARVLRYPNSANFEERYVYIEQFHHVIDVEAQRDQTFGLAEDRVVPSTPPSNLGKTFLSLTYQAAVGLMVAYFQNSLSSPSSSDCKTLLHIVEIAMVIGFAASLIGILLREAYPVKASIIERTGSVFAALGFFLMMGKFLPGIFKWIAWFAGVGSVLALILSIFKMK